MTHSYYDIAYSNVESLASYKAPNEHSNISAQGALQSIRTGRIAKDEDLRSAVSAARVKKGSDDKTGYDFAKSNMPCVCWGVKRFEGPARKEAIREFSGYVYFDADGRTFEEILKSGLAPYVISMWRSVSGLGIGGLVYAPWVGSCEDYALAYSRMNELSGGILDPSCKNADRKNVLSWDPDMYVRYEAESLERPEKGDVKYVPYEKDEKKGDVKYVPYEKDEKKGDVKYVPYEKEGIDLTEEGVTGAPYSRISRNTSGLSDCFGTFLLETGEEPMANDPRNPYLNSYYNQNSDFETKDIRTGLYTYCKESKLFGLTSPFFETITEPYLVCKNGIPCVRLYLPKTIRKGHRRAILLPFLINYYWKYPERLCVEHTFELISRMDHIIEGKLEDKKINDLHNYVQKMADSAEGITPSVTMRKVLFLNGSRIPAKIKIGISRTEIGKMQSESIEKNIENYVLSYSGNTKITLESIAASLGVSTRTIKRHWKGGLKELVKIKNEELGLYKTKKSQTDASGESKQKSDMNVQFEVKTSSNASVCDRDANSESTYLHALELEPSFLKI